MTKYIDEPPDHGKRMSSGQAFDAQGPCTTNLYPANTGVVGHGSEVREGMVWRWGEGKVYSGVPA